MPWVKKELCAACGLCVQDCPVGAVTIKGDSAVIDDDQCIRCGRCHDICPQDAVRHDSELIPIEIEANLAWIRKLAEHFETQEEKAALMKRLGRHFNKQITVATKTLERLKADGRTPPTKDTR